MQGIENSSKAGMQWDEDIDLLVGKKSAPKQGRRSNKNFDETESILESPKENEEIHIIGRKTGLWGDDAPKSSRSESGRNMIELERFQNERKTDSDDDIPIIPDIDDIQDEPLNLQDIKSTISVDKSIYKEIDKQFNNLKMEQSKIGKLDDIDLSYLTSKLYPEKDVEDCLEIWTLDSLFNDLSRNTV